LKAYNDTLSRICAARKLPICVTYAAWFLSAPSNSPSFQTLFGQDDGVVSTIQRQHAWNLHLAAP